MRKPELDALLSEYYNCFHDSLQQGGIQGFGQRIMNAKLESYWDLSKPQTTLEVGFGNGFHLKAVKDYRVKGIELGGFLSDRDGALLPHAGLVLKSYKQLGNVRFTSGIYTGKTTIGSPRSIQSALLFTIEVFDLF